MRVENVGIVVLFQTVQKSDIVSKYGGDSYKGDSGLCIVSDNCKRNIQGANSNLLKYDKILCSHCNNTRTQPFDKVYEEFITYLNENESEIVHKRFIDFHKIYGDDFENKQRNLYKYFVKSFGCRLAHFNHPIPSDMVELLGLDSFQTKLRLNFSVNEDKLYLGRLDVNLKNIIGNGKIETNQIYIDGNLGSTWVADNKFIYLGSFYSNLSDEMRQGCIIKQELEVYRVQKP